MKKVYYFKLIIISFLVGILVFPLTNCGIIKLPHKLTNTEVEQTVKAYLDTKYKQSFAVKVIKYNKDNSNEAGLNTPSYFNLEVINGYKKYNVIYAKDMKNPGVEIFKENIEGRGWNKEIHDYYSKLISEYCEDGYLKEVLFINDSAPSRVDMSPEEYITELNKRGSPFISIDYAVFVDNIVSASINSDPFKKIDSGILRGPDRYFSEIFYIVSKKDKESYIKKVDEYNKINSDFYNADSYNPDSADITSHFQKLEPLEAWFDSAVYTTYWFETNGFDVNSRTQGWGKSKIS